jgi:Transcriptional activator of glycolytic enzymes
MLLKRQVEEQQRELAGLKSLLPPAVQYGQLPPYIMPPMRPAMSQLPDVLSPAPEPVQLSQVTPQEARQDDRMEQADIAQQDPVPMVIDQKNPPAPLAPTHQRSENGALEDAEPHDPETEAGSALMALAQGARDDQTASTEREEAPMRPAEHQPEPTQIDGIPIPPMSGRLGTVQTIWEEWTMGWYSQSDPMHLNPSIQQLNRSFGESWRRTKIKGVLTKYQKNEYGRKKKVAHEIMSRRKALMESGIADADATRQAIIEVEEACKASKLPFTRWIDTLNKSKDLPDDTS